MNEKKHIDELFKEQLQNFEATPSPEVWNNIQAQMKKEKDDRKVIPLWWKLGGVAAVLALLFTVGVLIFNPSANNLNNTIVIEKEDKTNLHDKNHTPIVENTLSKDAISSEKNTKENIEKTLDKAAIEKESLNTLNDKIINKSKNNSKVLAVENNRVNGDLNKTNDLIKKNTAENVFRKKEGIATTSEKKVASERENLNKKEIQSRNGLIKDAISEGVLKNTKEGIAKTLDKNKNVNSKIDAEIETPFIKKDISEINKTKEAVAQEDIKKIDEAVKTETNENKKSIFDAIEENKEAAVTKIEKDNTKNWEVTPNFGPVFYNSLGNGSAIDPTFADNSQSGDVNFSYGVQVSYIVRDRLSLRSGISNVNLGYTTGDIELATGPVGIALKSVDYGGRSVVLSAFDKGTLANLPPPPPQGDGNPFEGLTPKSTSGNAELIQNLSYYEVPLELKYALINNRFGVNMIGGFSTLFLGDNEISVRDGEFKEVLGEANNLNSVSFTTNVGLGFDYKISKRLKFNIEPMFKYQLNPYSDSSVDFKPYYFGVYSGFSFKF